jgi:hypothetical protein
MNRWRVGEDMGSKEIDGCPLTVVVHPAVQYRLDLILSLTIDESWGWG